MRFPPSFGNEISYPSGLNQFYGFVGQSWMLENWGFGLDVLGSFRSCRRACHCKIYFVLRYVRFDFYCLYADLLFFRGE